MANNTIYDDFSRADGLLGGFWSPVVRSGAESMVNCLMAGIRISNQGFGPVSTGGGDAAALWTGLTFGNDQWARARFNAVTPYKAILSITAASQSAGNTTYTYTVTSGSIADVISGGRLLVHVTGMQNAGNNGFFMPTTFGTGTFTVANASGVTESGSTGAGHCPGDSGCGVMVRASGTTASTLNGYFYHVGLNSYWQGSWNGRMAYHELWKVVNGVGTCMALWQSDSDYDHRVPAVGDTIGISAVGSTITAWHNGYKLLSVTDTAVTSGVPGIWTFSMNGPDEYNAGNWTTTLNPLGMAQVTATKFGASDIGTDPNTPLASDTFPYANTSDLHTVNPLWINAQGTHSVTTISGHQVVASSTTGVNLAYRSDAAAGADQWSEVKMYQTGIAAYQNAGPAVRISTGSGNSCYCVQIGTDVYNLSKQVNGVFTNTLGSYGGAHNSGDIVRLAVVGNQLTVYLNGWAIITATDNDLTTGYPGIFGAYDGVHANTNGIQDSWKGGNTDITLTPTSQTHSSSIAGGATAQSNVRDSFTRADAGTLGANWTALSDATDVQTLGITSNGAKVQGTPGRAASFWNANTFANDQYSEAIVNVSATGTNSHIGGPIVRASANNYYAFIWDAGFAATQIFKVVNGVFTSLLIKSSSAAANGSLLRLEVVGNVLTGFVDGAAEISVTDTDLASGAPGVAGYMTAASPTMYLTNWAGGDIVWTRQGTVIAAGTTGGTEEPTVMYEANPHILSANPDGKIFKMWYTNGWGPQNTYPLVINYAESNDGLYWTNYASNPVISNGGALGTAVAHGFVIHVGNKYYAYYGNDSAASTGLDLWQSSDGVTGWTLTNALVVPRSSVSGEWDCLSIDNPVVWVENGTWYMLFIAISVGESTGGPYFVGLATSPDGITWTKYANNPVIGPGFTQVATYNFSTVESPLSDGGNFTAAGSGNPLPKVIAGNLCEPITTATTYGAYYTGATFNADQYSEVTIASAVGATDTIGLSVRMAGGSNTGYQLNIEGPVGNSSIGVQLWTTVSGTAHNQTSATISTTMNVGDVFRLAVCTITRSGTDNFLFLYKNGKQIWAYVDSTYAASITSGSPGFVLYAPTDITHDQISKWSGGNCDYRSRSTGKVIQKINGNYYLLGFVTPADGNLPTDLGLWKSSDLHTWTESAKNPVYERVLSTEGANLTGGQVADPSMVYLNNQTYLFYDTIDTQGINKIHINMATAPYTINQLLLLGMGDPIVAPSTNPAFPTGGVLMVPPFPSGGVLMSPPPPGTAVLMSPPPPAGGVLEYPDQYPFPTGGVKLWPS